MFLKIWTSIAAVFSGISVSRSTENLTENLRLPVNSPAIMPILPINYHNPSNIFTQTPTQEYCVYIKDTDNTETANIEEKKENNVYHKIHSVFHQILESANAVLNRLRDIHTAFNRFQDRLSILLIGFRLFLSPLRQRQGLDFLLHHSPIAIHHVFTQLDRIRFLFSAFIKIYMSLQILRLMIVDMFLSVFRQLIERVYRYSMERHSFLEREIERVPSLLELILNRYHNNNNHNNTAPVPVPELGRLAQHRENAMGQLSDKNNKSIAYLSNRYEKSINAQGGAQNTLEKKLKPYLEYKFSNISEEQKLLNIYHIVYRYVFLNPNPLISPHAEYAVNNERGEPMRGLIRDQDLQLLAYIYVAAEDKNVELPEGYNPERMKEFIIAQVGLIARAHNWDRTRLNTRTGKQEEYDDGERDKPSCSSGVRRRLAQILDILLVNAGSEYRTLGPQEFRNFYRSNMITGDQPGSLFQKIENLPVETLEQVSKGYGVYLNQLVADPKDSDDDVSEGEQEALTSFKENLKVTPESFQGCLEQAKAHFGAERITGTADPKPRTEDNTSCESYEAFAHTLRDNTLTLFSTVLKTKLDNETNKRKRQRQEETGNNKDIADSENENTNSAAKRSKNGVLSFRKEEKLVEKEEKEEKDTSPRVKRRRKAQISQ